MKSPAFLLSTLALLTAAATSASSDVDCSRKFKCLTDYTPVCGSDGKTYSNQCTLDNAACLAQQSGQNGSAPPLTKLFDGECSKKPNPFCGKNCPEIYKPVCGSDGVTYSNACVASAAKCDNVTVYVAHDGACDGSSLTSPAKCHDVCPLVFKEVCGSDGTTYGNDCLLGIAACKSPALQLAKVHDGACNSPRQLQAQEKGCTKIYLPVCGSDGNTYSNQCVLDNAASETPGLWLAHAGACAGPRKLRSEQEKACADIYLPACGSDGTTYSNQCMLENAASVSPGLALAHAGEC